MATKSHFDPADTAAETKKQNITLSLSLDTLKKARVLAAQRGTSLSGLLTQQIEQLTAVDEAYEQARNRELTRLRSGIGFDDVEHMTRDEMHDRRNFR